VLLDSSVGNVSDCSATLVGQEGTFGNACYTPNINKCSKENQD